MVDWADDVAELAEALEIDRFAVAGTSSGGPYALACAVKLPARVL
jgi:pimeloyl-ACP methyl ester carboxylesterase